MLRLLWDVAGLALAGRGLGSPSPLEIACFLLHNQCTHDFSWLIYILFEEKNESMELTQGEHGDCVFVVLIIVVTYVIGSPPKPAIIYPLLRCLLGSSFLYHLT